MLKDLAGRLLPPLFKHIPTNRRWLYPFYLAAQLTVRQEEYASDAFPPAFSGLRIAYASDIHFGSYLNQDRALAVTAELAGLGADLILLGGDYGEDIRTAAAYFDLIPPFPEGVPVLAAVGNHDHMGKGAGGINHLIKAMRGKGVIPLVNDAWILTRGGHSLAFCAADDILTGAPSFEPLKRQSRDADFVIFMSHSPDLVPEARKAGFAFDLALCGHTHGGQIALFGHSLKASSRYQDRYRMGWVREEGSDIFISCGVGTSVLPMRIGTRPEIHLFTLYPKQP